MVYDLNVESGKCRAHYYPNKESDYSEKIPIHVERGDKLLDNSVYSKSLDGKKVVTISAIAERTNGQVTALYAKL